MAESPKPLRIDTDIWTAVPERLDGLSCPVKVAVTLRPGDTRNGAITAFLRALLDSTE